MTSEDRAVVFLHVPKTAGSTLRSLLAAQYPSGRVFSQASGPGEREQPYLRYLREGGEPPVRALAPVGAPRHTEALAGIPAERRAHLRLVMGHFWFGVHEALPQPSSYVTVIRDPVERVLSLHHHRVAHHGLGQTAEEYVRLGRDFEIDNGQTRRLAGASMGAADIRFAPSSDEMLEAAKRNLRERFSVVGVTERLDEVIVLMERAFGWRIRGYLSRNVSKGRARDDAIGPELRRAVESRNELDRELHRFAGELQTELERTAGEGLAADLRRLRRWSAIYRRARPAVRVGNRLRRMRAGASS